MVETQKGVIWDLNSYFPSFNGPEMISFKQQLQKDIAELQNEAANLGELCEDNSNQWETLFLKTEDFVTRRNHLFSYIGCITSADALNEDYKKERADLAKLGAEFEKLDVDFLRALKNADDMTFSRFLERETLRDIRHFITRIRERAQKTMTREQEILAADLGVNGLHAWGRLYDTVTGKLEFNIEMPDGSTQRKPISEWRSLMSDVDFNIGKAAFTGGNKTWENIEDICAACLNAIAGVRLTLNKYRKMDHFLDKALFTACIEKKTLDAMYQAIHDRIETAREIFRIKSDYMGRKGIWFFEREAPLPMKDSSRYSWESGRDMVAKSFAVAYPDLGNYYLKFLANRWLESESRSGKLPGAFCTGSPLTKEQRVYMTFNGSIGDVTTLAHEVGHAFHGHVMKDMRTFAKGYPATLAETASIFGELILSEGIYMDSTIPDDQKLLMLDKDLSNAAVLLLDITVRFEFEKSFHEQRMNGELSVSRFKEIMVETQRRIWGDALADGGEDPMFWASKLHFYLTNITFYNFPYTFGFLMARSLYDRFKKEGPDFLPKYENFLRMTGSDTVENIAKKTLDVDISDTPFWTVAIDGLNDQLNLYRKLLKNRKEV